MHCMYIHIMCNWTVFSLRMFFSSSPEIDWRMIIFFVHPLSHTPLVLERFWHVLNEKTKITSEKRLLSTTCSLKITVALHYCK